MKIDHKIKCKKLQIILTEEPQKYQHQVKLNYTTYSCTKMVKLNYTNYFFGNSNYATASTNSIQSFITFCL